MQTLSTLYRHNFLFIVAFLLVSHKANLLDHYVKSTEEAYHLCLELLKSDSDYLFRGQTHDWATIAPSSFRAKIADQSLSIPKLNEFIEWAQSVPQMLRFSQDVAALTAIAQHYGIPTNFLDLTRNPEVAIMFASSTEPTDTNAVIYCFKRTDLENLDGVDLVSIDVENLWRLEAQEGLFLSVNGRHYAEKIREISTRIHFPGNVLSAEDYLKLYPIRKSALEHAIDQWIFRDGVSTVLHDFSSQIQFTFKIRRQTYPGSFKNRKIPEIEVSWFNCDVTWLFNKPENLPTSALTKVVLIVVGEINDLPQTIHGIKSQISSAIFTQSQTQELLHFSIQCDQLSTHDSTSIAILLNRVWDGIRLYPFTPEEKILCIATTSTFLLAVSIDDQDLETCARAVWTDVEAIEICPIGGHLDAGFVSKSSFEGALRKKPHSALTAQMLSKWSSSPLEVMDYITEHWILFEFSQFRSMFCQEFIPSSVGSYWKTCLADCEGQLEAFWSTIFNPVLIGYANHWRYKFTSPLANPFDCEQFIFLDAGTTELELVEIFTDCLELILSGGAPYHVLFHGFNFDHRPLWDIPEALAQCRAVVEIGGISVLHVVSESGRQDSETASMAPMGLGAFEIWAIANQVGPIWSSLDDQTKNHYWEIFVRDLEMSNFKLDTLLSNRPK